MPAITDAKILILATHGFEQSELMKPLEDLKAKGATVHVASPSGDAVKGWDGDDWGDSVASDLKLSDAKADDYHALVLPGGQINPDLLRVEPEAISLIQAFVKSGKIVAAVCHAPWLLIEAGVAQGRDMTCYKSIRTDLKNAGANVKDESVVVSNGIITSRNPDDLDDFVAKIVEEVEEGRHARPAA
ncbi:type 1 glutamine amidotransferase domain-containing protein [Jannaschia ovalis]|uniref:Type 1 glutamine amidotransferase n=1 Tax=Jannaschia ovalis TaxID=3038773 RepID=A0ABY8L8A3_9RHOB|nr:type 1 glutamine amidotransferase domain-containing protein [Jannaschia sp. GRR-S6-38]WGH77592.1 type 1 glutamine amidotransferase [Jannaschia sp. GRR-S6-38]